MLELKWITSPSPLLLWAQVLLAWAMVHYVLFRRDPTGVQEIGAWVIETGSGRRRGAVAVRSVLIGAIALILAGLSGGSLAFAVFCLVMAAGLPLGRPFFATKRMERSGRWWRRRSS